MKLRKCGVCKKDETQTRFTRRITICAHCNSEAAKKWRDANRERVRATKKAWKEANPGTRSPAEQ